MIVDALGHRIAVPSIGETTPPHVGDLWVVGHDGQDQGLVLVAAVREVHVLAWPITADTDHASAPAFRIDAPGLGRLVVWPEAEFGLSMASLSRRVGTSHDDRALREIRWHISAEGPMPAGVDVCPEDDSPEAMSALEAACDLAWTLGEWTWPNVAPGQAALNREALNDLGLNLADVARRLHTNPGQASRITTGSAIPTAEQVDILLTMLPSGTEAADVLVPVHGVEAKMLARPRFKAEVQRVRAARRVSEVEARSLIWETSASTAARQRRSRDTEEQAAETRIEQAIRNLLASD